MVLRTLRIVFAGTLFAGVAVSACGNTSDSTPTTASGGSGGSLGQAGSAGRGGSSGAVARGGSGGDSATQSVACGTSSCKEATLPIPGAPLVIPGCCSNADTGTCGLDSTFLAMYGPTFAVACQPLAQPGTLDKTCPDRDTTVSGVNISFPGCCRANGSCGYQLDNIGGLPQLHLGLGCVDSSPFLDGGTPNTCGDMGAAGAGEGGGGPGSAAGAPGAAGESAAGGASSG
jgi:hypothetical protein